MENSALTLKVWTFRSNGVTRSFGPWITLVKTASSSDSTSEDSDSDREVKSEFVKSEPQYSPGGGGDSPNESYTPAKPKKEKPYRPGGFFFDDDEEEEEDDDNEMAGFIQGEDDVDEEEDEEDSNPFFNSGKELQLKWGASSRWSFQKWLKWPQMTFWP